MRKSELAFIFSSYLIWRIGIVVFAFLAIKFVPLFSHNFLGGGFQNYSSNPLFWGNLNFDGEHYLAVAQFGYQPLTYFYFPVFPYLIKIFSLVHTQTYLALMGLVISNISFLFALIGIYKLVKLDYKENIARLTVILFLVFPTSFYFGAYYTESIFLLFVVWSFYFVRQQRIFISSILVAILSATRIIGIVMFPVLILEVFLQKKRNYWPIFISSIGILLYMYFLFRNTGDPLNFLNNVSIFGQQRSSTLILLPQVIYRYLFKILPILNYSYFPVVFTTYLEFVTGILFFILIVWGVFKLRLSYSLYAILAYLVPTFAGSFSSMPRYVLVIFPVFIFMAIVVDKMKFYRKCLLFSVMLILMIIATAMFWRGYWIG